MAPNANNQPNPKHGAFNLNALKFKKFKNVLLRSKVEMYSCNARNSGRWGRRMKIEVHNETLSQKAKANQNTQHKNMFYLSRIQCIHAEIFLSQF